MVATVSIAIKTRDRAPRKDFLEETMENLRRAGIHKSAHFDSLFVVDGAERTLHQNAQTCIEVASIRKTAKYTMVLEDDLDFVNDFLENAVAWLEANPGFEMYALGANYAQIVSAVRKGRDYWLYPVGAFYGAQALVWRRETAEQLAKWLGPDPEYNGVRDHGHDLKLQQWGRERGAEFFLASAPSMVQHIGNESGIGNRFFQFESFPGHEWKYERRSV
jgi:hypothetical protein